MRAWEDFLVKQEKELGKQITDKWLRPLKVVRFDACNLYLEAQDSFQKLWFEEHMRSKTNSAFYNNNHKKIKVHLNSKNWEQEKSLKPEKKEGASAIPPFVLRFDELDPDARFDSFVTCPSNLLVYKLLCEVCAIDPDTLKAVDSKAEQMSFNPIYLFGHSGTGKTHLMMAAAHSLKQAGLKVVYVRAETFTEHVVGAIRAGQMQLFRKAYRDIDALLIDDIEIFSRKNATQEELFHTFNTLHTAGKQLIFSASSAAQELKYIEPRLISRFEWGIAIPLQTPEKEHLRTILLDKSQKIDFPLEQSVISFLLSTFGKNTTTLIRALEALVLRTHLNQGLGNAPSLPLGLNAAQNYLSDLILEEQKAVLTPGKILTSVAEYFGIRSEDILSKSQARESALPRQIAMHLCRKQLNLPFMKIGDIFSRDHSTVMASVKQIENALTAKTHEIAAPVKEILKTLNTSA